jgi:hypothetical protein
MRLLTAASSFPARAIRAVILAARRLPYEGIDGLFGCARVAEDGVPQLPQHPGVQRIGVDHRVHADCPLHCSVFTIRKSMFTLGRSTKKKRTLGARGDHHQGQVPALTGPATAISPEPAS